MQPDNTLNFAAQNQFLLQILASSTLVAGKLDERLIMSHQKATLEQF
jgi:hypothetical protein